MNFHIKFITYLLYFAQDICWQVLLNARLSEIKALLAIKLNN